MADTCILFAPKPDYRAPIEGLRLVADEVEIFGPKSAWTRLEAALGAGVTVTLTQLKPGDEPGDAASSIMRATVDHFHGIEVDGDGATVRDELVRRIGASGWVLRLEAEPALGEEWFEAIAGILRALDGMLFDGSGMMDADGSLILDADGSTEQAS